MKIANEVIANIITSILTVLISIGIAFLISRHILPKFGFPYPEWAAFIAAVISFELSIISIKMNR